MPLPISLYDRIRAGEDPAIFCTCGCLNPQKVSTYNPCTGNHEDMYVDCGKCPNCANARRKEWVSRMILTTLGDGHGNGYKHVYFVTLTFGSYNLMPYKNHPFKKDWLSMYPTPDTYNSSNVRKWSPTLLQPFLAVKFMKRLRKLVNSPIQFAMCGEYGDTYSRPHFHYIIWSHDHLTKDVFENAWSYDVYAKSPLDIRTWTPLVPIEKRQKFHIGSVHYEDLVVNHTCDLQAAFDPNQSSNKSVHKMFAYVCSYIQKTDWQPSPILIKRIQGVFDINKINNSYENPIDENFAFPRPQCQPKFVPATSAEEVAQEFAPFFRSSRRPALGFNYLSNHLAEFEAGLFRLPTIQGRALTFPRYFYRKISEQRYPLRVLQHSPKCASLTKTNIKMLREYFLQLRDCGHNTAAISIRLNVMPLDGQNIFLRNYRVGYVQRFCTYGLGEKKHGNHVIVPGMDKLSELTFCYPRMKVHYRYEPRTDCFLGYYYVRSAGRYEMCDELSRFDYCEMVLEYIDNELQYNKDHHAARVQKYVLTDTIIHADNFKNIRDNYLDMVAYRQNNYKQNHPDTLYDN